MNKLRKILKNRYIHCVGATLLALSGIGLILLDFSIIGVIATLFGAILFVSASEGDKF